MKRLSFLLRVLFLATLSSLSSLPSHASDTPAKAQGHTILFFGDSLSAGYGVEPDEAFPAVIQRKIDAAGLPWHVVNAGVSGDTSSDGLHRIDWVLRQHVDIFVLELGANDGLRGQPVDALRENLTGIVAHVRAKYPKAKIVLAGMQMPPSHGEEYTTAFQAVFPELAHELDLTLIPFLLDRVGGDPALNQDDDMHPNREGHKIVAETVWTVLRPLL